MFTPLLMGSPCQEALLMLEVIVTLWQWCLTQEKGHKQKQKPTNKQKWCIPSFPAARLPLLTLSWQTDRLPDDPLTISIYKHFPLKWWKRQCRLSEQRSVPAPCRALLTGSTALLDGRRRHCVRLITEPEDLNPLRFGSSWTEDHSGGFKD